MEVNNHTETEYVSEDYPPISQFLSEKMNLKTRFRLT